MTTGNTTFLAGVSTWMEDADFLEEGTLTIGSVKYDAGYCGDYGIYYLNRYGGWDAFLFEGLCKKSDQLTEHKYSRSVNNQTDDFENNRYMVEISPKYTLTTGWLTDEEAANFAANVISTTKLYLHNLREDEIIPAVITDTTADYKTFKNNGRKMVSYTLTVVESQTKVRR